MAALKVHNEQVARALGEISAHICIVLLIDFQIARFVARG